MDKNNFESKYQMNITNGYINLLGSITLLKDAIDYAEMEKEKYLKIINEKGNNAEIQDMLEVINQEIKYTKDNIMLLNHLRKRANENYYFLHKDDDI
jgi:hypothetical protein